MVLLRDVSTGLCREASGDQHRPALAPLREMKAFHRIDLAPGETKHAELARAGFRSSVQVGRYGVNLEAFERLALPELARRDVDLIVIDEIGKMECASQRFCRTLEDALDAPVRVLATLGIARLPFLQSVRNRPDVELLTLTERNRNALVLLFINTMTYYCCHFSSVSGTLSLSGGFSDAEAKPVCCRTHPAGATRTGISSPQIYVTV